MHRRCRAALALATPLFPPRLRLHPPLPLRSLLCRLPPHPPPHLLVRATSTRPPFIRADVTRSAPVSIAACAYGIWRRARVCTRSPDTRARYAVAHTHTHTRLSLYIISMIILTLSLHACLFIISSFPQWRGSSSHFTIRRLFSVQVELFSLAISLLFSL